MAYESWEGCEIVKEKFDFKKEVSSVLDLGSGTGSALWALENYVNKIKQSNNVYY